MLENMSPASVKARVLARIAESSELDTREGSFVHTMVGPVAEELARMDEGMDAMFALAFPDESSGTFLDVDGAPYGLVRKEGRRATAVIDLVGSPNEVIPKWTTFLTSDLLTFELAEDVVLSASGTGRGLLSAEEIGAAYNVPAGAVTRTYTIVPGLISFACGAAEGGVDEESDADFFARISAYKKRPATSENQYYYEQLALEVIGVGFAKVTMREFGRGTIGIMLASPEKGAVSAAVIDALEQEIAERHLICDEVHVYSVMAIPITVSAVVLTDGSISANEVRSALYSRLSEYLQGMELGFDREVSFNQISHQLLSIPGVLDHTSLTLNDGTESVPINAASVAVLEGVDVS